MRAIFVLYSSGMEVGTSDVQSHHFLCQYQRRGRASAPQLYPSRSYLHLHFISRSTSNVTFFFSSLGQYQGFALYPRSLYRSFYLRLIQSSSFEQQDPFGTWSCRKSKIIALVSIRPEIFSLSSQQKSWRLLHHLGLDDDRTAGLSHLWQSFMLTQARDGLSSKCQVSADRYTSETILILSRSLLLIWTL